MKRSKAPKKIAEGAYGCVYSPAVTPEGHLQPEYINKIQVAKKATEKEPYLGEKLRTIPHYRRYYAPSQNVSPLVVSAISQKEIQKCEVLERNKDRQIVVSKIPYVGTRTLGEQIEMIEENLPNTTLSHLQSYQAHLEVAVKQMANSKIGIVHNDIKQNNVMYSDLLQCPILIDFGLSYCVHDLSTKEEIKNAFEIYSEKYPSSPVDVVCIGKIVNIPEYEKKKVNWDEIKETIHNVYHTNPIYDSIREDKGDSYMQKKETQCLSKMKSQVEQYNGKKYRTKQLKNITNSEFIDALLDQNCDTWDLYSINVMMYKQVNKLLDEENHRTTKAISILQKKEKEEYREKLINQIMKYT